MLSKHAGEMRRIMRHLDEAAPVFRSTGSEVERLIDAMLTNSKVQAKMRAVVGKDGDVEGLVAELYQQLPLVVAAAVRNVGGAVSGTSQATIKSGLRSMAQGEAAPEPAAPLAEGTPAAPPADPPQ